MPGKDSRKVSGRYGKVRRGFRTMGGEPGRGIFIEEAQLASINGIQ